MLLDTFSLHLSSQNKKSVQKRMDGVDEMSTHENKCAVVAQDQKRWGGGEGMNVPLKKRFFQNCWLWLELVVLQQDKDELPSAQSNGKLIQMYPCSWKLDTPGRDSD